MDLAGQAIRVVGALGLVLATIFLVAYGFKRAGYLGKFTRDPSLIEIVARKSLNPRNQLVIVKVHEQYYLLGMSPQGIQRLGQLDPLDRESILPAAG